MALLCFECTRWSRVFDVSLLLVSVRIQKRRWVSSTLGGRRTAARIGGKFLEH